MSKLGDLSKFVVAENKLTDFSWLDIDPKDYNNVPFDSLPAHIAIPKLEEAWSHEDATKNFNLVPNMNMDYNVPQPKAAPEKDSTDILNLIKKQMMQGLHGQDLAEIVKSSISPEILKNAKDTLVKLAEEQGLLGNVYIDPSVFNRCADGSKLLEKKCKLAKYVKKMAKCSGCMYNKNERCEVYKKMLASEIVYDSRLLNFYANHFSNKIGKMINLESKKALASTIIQFSKKEQPSSRVAEFKPSVNETTEKTLPEKELEFQNAYADITKGLSNFEQDKTAQEVSQMMLKGYSNKIIKEHFSSRQSQSDKKIVQSIISKQGSLGKVYIEAKLLPFKNCSEARDFLKDHATTASYLIDDSSFCKCANSTKCNNLNKIKIASLNNIPNTAFTKEFENYSTDVRNKIAHIFNSDPIRGLRLASIQKELKVPSPVSESKDENYNLVKEVNPNFYQPDTKKAVSLTSEKVASALKQGYTINNILATGKKLGFDLNVLSNTIKTACLMLKSINKYQVSSSVVLADTVKIIENQKDVNKAMSEPISQIPNFVNSSTANVEDINALFDIQSSELNVTISDNKKDIEITGLNSINF